MNCLLFCVWKDTVQESGLFEAILLICTLIILSQYPVISVLSSPLGANEGGCSCWRILSATSFVYCNGSKSLCSSPWPASHWGSWENQMMCSVEGLLIQWSPTCLAPGTGFVEDSFSMIRFGCGLGIIQVHYIYYALYVYYYYFVIIMK